MQHGSGKQDMLTAEESRLLSVFRLSLCYYINGIERVQILSYQHSCICAVQARCHWAYRLSLPEEHLGSPITWVAAVLLQLWRQIPVWLLFFLLSKAQAASSTVRPMAAKLLSAVLNKETCCQQPFRTAYYSLAEAVATREMMLAKPS